MEITHTRTTDYATLKRAEMVSFNGRHKVVLDLEFNLETGAIKDVRGSVTENVERTEQRFGFEVSIYGRSDWKTKEFGGLQINWGSIGAQSVETANDYAELLSAAVEFSGRMSLEFGI